MRITQIAATVLVDEGRLVDNRRQTTLISIRADEGLVGYGDANATPLAVKALIESPLGRPCAAIGDASIRETLVGEDPADPGPLCSRLKALSPWSCRTGLGHVAIAGVEMALWDLAGKIHGAPVWKLLGPQKNQELLAYVTIYHGPTPYRETVDRTVRALNDACEAGYRAAKVEPLSNNTSGSDEIVGLAAAARAAVGPDFILLADVGYRWTDPEEAIECAKRLDELQMFALEAPFPPDDIDSHVQLANAILTPLASGDMLTAAVDYLPLLQSGCVRYVQAGAARTGIGDMSRLARIAAQSGKGLITWGFVPTGLAAAANLHVAVVHENVPLLEHAPPSLYPESRIRSELCFPELEVVDGHFTPPSRPGFGIEINQAALRELTYR